MLEVRRAPKSHFGEEEHADPISRLGEMRVVRIMGATDEVEAGCLDQAHIAFDRAIGDRIAPARLILMDVRAPEIPVAAIEEKALIGGPFEPAESELSLEPVALASVDAHSRHGAIKIGRFRAP